MTETPSNLRRFSTFHRVLHWMIAIPYIALMISGTILLLLHVGWVAHPTAQVTGQVHRWIGWAFTGIVLQMIFAGFVGGKWRIVGRDLLAWLRNGPRDVLWLMLVPLNAIAPRWVRLPRAGRFNAGQKLHGLFILVAIVGFIVTGVIMILIPGWITVWRVHVVLFAGAVFFFGLHLFLSLINPSTRTAVSGMFTGWVSRKYVEYHHPLELDPTPERGEPHAIVSIRALLVTVVGIVVALYAWWTFSVQRPFLETIEGPWQTAMLMPGPLGASHANKIGADDCVACHTNDGTVTDSACIECHKQIDTDRIAKRGFHATLVGECAMCHVEHRGETADLRGFDSRAFNHDLAAFKLSGAHRTAECQQCHLQHSPVAGETHFIGMKFANCTDCHTNVHTDMPATDCARCHTEQGWTGQNLVFDHNRDSSFKIDALHSGLTCNRCHTTEPMAKLPTFRGAPATCVQCHRTETDALAGRIGQLQVTVDPHNGRVSCVECHKTDVRTQTSQEYAASCVACHNEAYRSLYFDWQKSLSQHEQQARFRLTTAKADPNRSRDVTALIDQARAAGMHNTQAAVDILKKAGK